MKKLNNFLDNAPMWKVYIFSYLVTTLFMFLIFSCFNPLMTTEGQKIFTMTVILKVSALTGILFGLMLALMISMMRSSSRFWKYSEEVAKLINEAETKDALKGIYKNEFSKLREMMGGRPHLEEVKRLYAILETKHKYIKC